MLRGSLFTEDFLREGITDYSEWRDLPDEELEAFSSKLRDIFSKFPIDGNPIEATTEDDLIKPILEALGWDNYLTQQTTARKGRADIPDFLLFPTQEAKLKANDESEQHKRYIHGTAILEAKAWNVLLDRKGNQALDRVPSNQIIRYLTSVDVQSNGHIQWGILTNGRLWRIYYNRAKSKSEDFLELNLPLALGLTGFQGDLFTSETQKEQDWVKAFYLLFRSQAFNKVFENKTFHEKALEEAGKWESQVAEDLSDVVFKDVFPALLEAIKNSDPEAPSQVNATYLEELRDNALIFLYRILFILYAEDRYLLPVNDDKYDDYGLYKHIRLEAKRQIDESDALSPRASRYYNHINDLFNLIDKGDDFIGLPAYNGGLFNTKRTPLLNRVKVSDAALAPLIDKLSRRTEGEQKKWINYRDLSVQQLGSIYERLLEFYPKIEEDGTLNVKPNLFARKTSGSYYTPESLVSLLLENTVGPLIKEKRDLFYEKIEEFQNKVDKKDDRNERLQRHDPANNILELRVCDPAMGSGHFLVSLVDYLADEVLQIIDECETEGVVPWSDEKNPYVSPVSERIILTRNQIREEATKHGWHVKEEQLDDKQIVRRMILKRCVYGVDKNPMAVELAKVALWLHTFTVGAPLSFLDHHLRDGDSLFGEWVGTVQSELRERGSLLSNDTIIKAKQSALGMQKIERMTDADIAEAKESASTFKTIEEATDPLHNFLKLYHALRWVSSNSTEDKQAIQGWLDGKYGDVVRIAENKTQIFDTSKAAQAFLPMLDKARNLIKEENFMSWEVSFPGVWDNWDSDNPIGGFDAIIGNPPWDRMKMQEVEYFENRKPEIARQSRAADRKKMIAELKKSEDPLYTEYKIASDRAAKAMEVAKKAGLYPLMSKGDFNIYALFVEKAQRLIKDKGYVGLVVPVGIAYDKGNSEFFGKLSQDFRISTMFVFENKGGKFFKDVHHEDKFTTFVFGGNKKEFKEIDCAFFLHDISELSDTERRYTLKSSEFSRINPNTKTAPIFRNKRDAKIVGHIYGNNPILIDKSTSSAKRLFPVKYDTMFHMTSDSGLFMTLDDLDEMGAYPIGNSILKYEGGMLLPLLEGKMIHLYNHRYASIKSENTNVSGQGVGVETTIEQLEDPEFTTTPRYWVKAEDIKWPKSLEWALSFRDTTNVNNWRTVISSIVPKLGCGNTLPMLIPEAGKEMEYKKLCPYIIANMNCTILDYVSRQKIQARHLNAYILEQLPFIKPDTYSTKLGDTTVGEFIKQQVLKLTYTSWDMQPFAKDMGYEGNPFEWNEEERMHLMAKLDALYMNLYNISEDDAEYVLSTFDVARKYEVENYGYYATKDLVINYMRALKAGDTEIEFKIKSKLVA